MQPVGVPWGRTRREGEASWGGGREGEAVLHTGVWDGRAVRAKRHTLRLRVINRTQREITQPLFTRRFGGWFQPSC